MAASAAVLHTIANVRGRDIWSDRKEWVNKPKKLWHTLRVRHSFLGFKTDHLPIHNIYIATALEVDAFLRMECDILDIYL
jgi:hypothetical protein